MINSTRLSWLMEHASQSMFKSEHPRCTRSFPNRISPNSREFSDSHLIPFIGLVPQSSDDEHFRKSRKVGPTWTTFRTVGDDHPSDETVRARLWGVVSGSTPMPHPEDLVVETEFGSVDKFIHTGRKMTKKQMQTIFRRMRTKG